MLQDHGCVKGSNSIQRVVMNSMEFKSKLSRVGQQTYFGKALAAKIEKFYSFGEVLMLIYDDIQDGRLQVE